MSRERKNDRHVPLGPARRLVPRPSNASVSSSHPKGVTVVREAKTSRNARSYAFAVTLSRTKTFFSFFSYAFQCHQKAYAKQKAASSRVLWRPPSSLAYTLRLAQRRHAEIEQNGALGPDDRSRRSLPATRGTVPASIATASPPRRAIACRPARFLPPTPTETDRCPPPAPRPQEAIFPEALKSLKEADPDVYALVQKEKLRQMCVQAPTRTNATRSRAIDAMSSFHTTDCPNLATGVPLNDD